MMLAFNWVSSQECFLIHSLALIVYASDVSSFSGLPSLYFCPNLLKAVAFSPMCQ